MPHAPDVEITRLLKAWAGGDHEALDRLTPTVYDELRRMARRRMRREREGHTLQATALVNEVYVRLVDAGAVNWKDRAHFFAISAQMMRRILVDAARARICARRGGGAHTNAGVDLDQVADAASSRSRDMVALDDALRALAGFDSRKAQVVELRYFGGLGVEETAQVLNISAQTVMRDWKLAKAWLQREIG